MEERDAGRGLDRLCSSGSLIFLILLLRTSSTRYLELFPCFSMLSLWAHLLGNQAGLSF